MKDGTLQALGPAYRRSAPAAAWQPWVSLGDRQQGNVWYRWDRAL